MTENEIRDEHFRAVDRAVQLAAVGAPARLIAGLRSAVWILQDLARRIAAIEAVRR